MSKDGLIQAAEDLRAWLHERLQNRAIHASDRNRVATALSQHAQDLSDSVVILVRKNLPGPALTLARPMVEAYMRSVWILKCASEEDIDGLFCSDPPKRGWPKFASMTKRLVERAPDESEWVSFVMQGLDELHDLTHSGKPHVLNRMTESTVQPNYSDQDVETLLGYAIEAQIRAGCLLVEVSNDPELMEDLEAYLERLNRSKLNFQCK